MNIFKRITTPTQIGGYSTAGIAPPFNYPVWLSRNVSLGLDANLRQ